MQDSCAALLVQVLMTELDGELVRTEFENVSIMCSGCPERSAVMYEFISKLKTYYIPKIELNIEICRDDQNYSSYFIKGYLYLIIIFLFLS